MELSSAIAEPCREWRGSFNSTGYGVRYGVSGRFGTELVHRQVMMMVHGRGRVKGKVVMHLCDNPKCYRFSHLRLGSHADNVADKVAKNRQYKKLSKSDVEEIAKKRKLFTLEQLGEQYGVSKSTIDQALRVRRKEKRARLNSRIGKGQREVH